ncbi:PulJ/GspJ family protein [Bacillus marinisedimentorum]|uniref:PulJ/GspJ family protein n=1 Tax=Bacillus marinisedimentorum TaxID=1821260 RepID=UPI000872E3FE|nr:prepilin-type N-terminal cleavage/methylation domain-containing protein [Bacillus marinisedimentorum]
MRTKVSGEEGFTLMEVMLAFTILAIAAVPFFMFFTQSMMFSAENGKKLAGIQTAREVMAYIHEKNVTAEDFTVTIDGNRQALDWSPLISDDSEAFKKTAVPHTVILEQNQTDYFVRVVSASFNGPAPAGGAPLQPVAVEVYSDADAGSFVTETFGYVGEGS